MHVVYLPENVIDAHLVRGRLNAEGIDAFIRGEFLTGALGELPARDLLAVCVGDADLARARSLIAEWGEECPPDVASSILIA